MPRNDTAPRPVHSERARWAWDRVSLLQQDDRSTREYATHVRKLPARIQVTGLGQTLAFLFAKSAGAKALNGAGRLLTHLGERIALIDLGLREASRGKIMDTLVNMSPDMYRRCTHELLLTAEWLKRFVDGTFDKEADET